MHTKIINVYSLTEAGSGVTVISFGNKCYRKDTGIQNLLLITQLLYPLVAFCGWFANIHKRVFSVCPYLHLLLPIFI